ncbi:MAPK regulated corepressor interacting protein 2 [Varanus komodoensis]|uniref:MAPK regulated corepressor interacting protein 2 n=1 Tax=Varanus komodoensis TaxID=61221 RepID=A0A8D2L4E4_VARKO|nr:MAPK regulated corepressor interacting protein 2 [Varanus komodoensis]
MMYTITRGPSKLATQRRTGPTQQVESKLADLKCRRRQQQQQQLSSWPLSSSAPKLVFNRLNGKRRLLVSQSTSATEESYTVAHEENVRFVYEAWQQVEQQLSDSQQGQSGAGPVQYMDKTPSPELKDFVPIDLEEWWAQQFLATIENGS